MSGFVVCAIFFLHFSPFFCKFEFAFYSRMSHDVRLNVTQAVLHTLRIFFIRQIRVISNQQRCAVVPSEAENAGFRLIKS